MLRAAVQRGEVVSADSCRGGYEDNGAGFLLPETRADGHAGEFYGVLDVDLWRSSALLSVSREDSAHIQRSVRPDVVLAVVPEVTPQRLEYTGDGGVDIGHAAELLDGGGNEGVQRRPVVHTALLEIECFLGEIRGPFFRFGCQAEVSHKDFGAGSVTLLCKLEADA